MNDELPRRDARHASGERGLAVLKLALPTQWIVRNLPESDYGIDIEVEIADKHATGVIFKAQVRSKSPIVWKSDGTYRESFTEGKLRYWRMLPVPVILFLCDNDSNTAFWAAAEPLVPAAERVGDAVIVSRSRQLPATTAELEAYIRRYVHHRVGRQVLYRVPDVARAFAVAKDQIGYDFHLPLDDDELESVRRLYEDVLSLRAAVGLSNSQVLPWDLWCERSAVLFGDYYLLYWGVHDELIPYIESFLSEAMSAAKAILDSEEYSVENQRAKNHFSDCQCTIHPRLSDVPWDEIEQHLDSFGVRRFGVKNIKEEKK